MATLNKRYQLQQFGPSTKRRDYSQTVNNLPVTDLLAVQKESFEWFLKEGLNEIFQNIYPIESKNKKIILQFKPKSLRIEKPEDEYKAINNAKQRKNSYNFKIYATLVRVDVETGEVADQEVLFGEIPLMTRGGSFIINGSEKVIVSQLLRSPGAYYGTNVRVNSSSGDDLFNKLEIIPKLGPWIEVLHRTTGDSIDYVKLAIDKHKKVSLSIFLRAMGISRENIRDLFGNYPILESAIKKDTNETEELALEELFRVVRKGDLFSKDTKKNFFANLFFSKRRYDLSKTGRYILNRKLNLVERITNTILAKDLIDSEGVLRYEAGKYIDFDLAKKIQNEFDHGIFSLIDIPGIKPQIYGWLVEEKETKNIANRVKMIEIFVNKNIEEFNAKVTPIRVIGTDPTTDEVFLVVSDIIAAISYHFNLADGLGEPDDPDSLINKRVVTIGELLQNQFQIGLTRLERNAKEKMSSMPLEKITPKNVTNNKAIYNQFKSFFNSSQLSQFMDQINPLAEMANKRRLTSLGPGGLNRETAVFEVRDVHATHYGRVCPIETPEGPNIGLILNFANYSRINELGFIETPYFPVKNRVVSTEPVYLTAYEERGKSFAQSSIELDSNGRIVPDSLTVRKDADYQIQDSSNVDYLDVSSKQMTSIAAAAIPFLENNDANRALMGANMQRQAVPLLKAEAPLVATGIEADIAQFSAGNIRSDVHGIVSYVDSEKIEIKKSDAKGKVYKYNLRTFERSNQGSVICQKPLVKVGDEVQVDQLITDGTSFDQGELAIGKNVVVAFTTWNGYNYEDAVIMSERLYKDDVYTSLHVEERMIEFRKAKAGDDELTFEIPNVSHFAKRNLNGNGIVNVGSEVKSGDVLVGRVSPKGEDNPTPEEKLIVAIFSKRMGNLKDTSLKVKHGHGGTVIDVEIMARDCIQFRFDDVKKLEKFIENDELADFLISKFEFVYFEPIFGALKNAYEKEKITTEEFEVANDFLTATRRQTSQWIYSEKIDVLHVSKNIVTFKIEKTNNDQAKKSNKASKAINKALLASYNKKETAFLTSFDLYKEFKTIAIEKVIVEETKLKNTVEKKCSFRNVNFYFLPNTIKLQDDVEMIVRVFVAQKRKIKPGDKMAGRHGNKGVISRILPEEDMPHLADGTIVDIMLNPQGVPSRMNIGQVLELHLGMAAKSLGVKFVTPVFDGIKYGSIHEALEEAGLPKNGKFDLYDPTSGKKFDNEVSVGVMYMVKLAHMVDDKMHARSVGPYSLITQQPLGGKSQNGGQRFGEMETWAIESYGATNVLQELLTYKSDHIEGRNKIYNALANGAPLPKPGLPESFNVLAYELRGLGIKLGLEVSEDAEHNSLNTPTIAQAVEEDDEDVWSEDEILADIEIDDLEGIDSDMVDDDYEEVDEDVHDEDYETEEIDFIFDEYDEKEE